ncbi:unnamed protein product [Musa hybrid cultivar]
MGPSKKKCQVSSKCFPELSEERPCKNKINAVKNKIRKRNLSDMLGSQWSKVEVVQFFEAYHKYGKDWKKVAATLPNKSSDAVEALYNMNKAYLSLPEGSANATGLIAMMIDHYNILEGGDSDQENYRFLRTYNRPQKHGRVSQIVLPKGSKGLVSLQKQSIPSSSGCMPSLRKIHFADTFGGGKIRCVGKRTPRFPVAFLSENIIRDNLTSSNKQCSKSKAEVFADEGMHLAALALIEASQIFGSPLGSQSIDRVNEQIGSPPVLSGDSKMANIDIGSAGVDGCFLEGKLASKEGCVAVINRDTRLQDTDISSAIPMEYKMQKLQTKRSKGQINMNYQAEKGTCINTEGVNVRNITCKIDAEDREAKCAFSSQGRKKKLLKELSSDERNALDALLDLGNLTPDLFHTSASEAELRSHESNWPKVRKDRDHISNIEVHCVTQKDKNGSNIPPQQDYLSEANQRSCPTTISKPHKGKGKFLGEEIQKCGTGDKSHLTELQKNGVSIEDMEKSFASQPIQLSEQGKLSHKLEISLLNRKIGGTTEDKTISTKCLAADNLSMHNGTRTRCKLNLKKEMAQKQLMSSCGVGDECQNNHSRFMNMKGTLANCLSSQLFRRWCTFEWFYSAIDYPWFAKNDYVEYLNHARLSHIPRFRRAEWSIIRRSLGKARRFSNKFLSEERMKVEQYRESVRTHYTELLAGTTEGLSRDLAIPLSVGQHVIACHPKTREIHDGTILSVGRSSYRVQFDRPELGVEFVMDIDCMPLGPWKNMSDDLERQNVPSQLCKSLIVKKTDDFIQQKTNDIPNIASNEIVEVAHMPHFKFSQSSPYKQAKQEICSKQCPLSQMETREADTKALVELMRALKKKKALMTELSHMNEEVTRKQNDDSITNVEHLRMQLLLQLQEAGNQVGSAILELRQHNTFQGKLTSPWFRSTENSVLAGPCSNSESYVLEVVETSRQKAKTLVDQSVQAMFAVEGRKDALASTREVLYPSKNWSSGVDSDRLDTAYTHIPEVHKLATRDEKTSGRLGPANIQIPGLNLEISSDANLGRIPSELISTCVAALFMIEGCTRRQYPPAEVAEILELAVTSLQPCFSQNLPIYWEIQAFMRIIKSQMLALVPTPSIGLSTVSVQ